MDALRNISFIHIVSEYQKEQRSPEKHHSEIVINNEAISVLK